MTTNTIPKPALVLGLAGLIPFVCSALLTLSDNADVQSFATMSLAAYGAVILSFLGGVKWGIALSDNNALTSWQPLILSVLPSIVGWLALLLPAIFMLIVLSAALVGQYCLDNNSVQQQKLPIWYGKLRLILSCGAVLSLLIGLWAHL